MKTPMAGTSESKAVEDIAKPRGTRKPPTAPTAPAMPMHPAALRRAIASSSPSRTPARKTAGIIR